MLNVPVRIDGQTRHHLDTLARELGVTRTKLIRQYILEGVRLNLEKDTKNHDTNKLVS